jgi:hypothetical protein
MIGINDRNFNFQEQLTDRSMAAVASNRAAVYVAALIGHPENRRDTAQRAYRIMFWQDHVLATSKSGHA